MYRRQGKNDNRITHTDKGERGSQNVIQYALTNT